MTSEDGDKNYIETIANLEEALDAEKHASTSLRATLAAIESKVAALEIRLDKKVSQALARAEKAEQKLEDQSLRLEALGEGREAGMLALNNMRAELELVAAERDRLRSQLTAVEGMQTETANFDDSVLDEPTSSGQASADADDGLPSIEELMANLGSAGDGMPDTSGFGQAIVEAPSGSDDGEWQEMIAPELIVLGDEKAGRQAAADVQRKLVVVDEDYPMEYPIVDALMTIGRSESADIRIDGNFSSRIHARVLTIGDEIVVEDAGSRNGIRVNSERVSRQSLKHGDLLRIGSARFRLYDARSAAETPS
jgi:hypothetical protein